MRRGQRRKSKSLDARDAEFARGHPREELRHVRVDEVRLVGEERQVEAVDRLGGEHEVHGLERRHRRHALRHPEPVQRAQRRRDRGKIGVKTKNHEAARLREGVIRRA